MCYNQRKQAGAKDLSSDAGDDLFDILLISLSTSTVDVALSKLTSG